MAKEKFTYDVFAPQDLASLDKSITNCQACKIGKPCITTEQAGSYKKGIIFIGEAPGGKEAKLGRPFSGPAGEEFDTLLLRGGFYRADIYCTNVVRARPLEGRRNRTPKDSEIQACLPHLMAEIAIIDPRIMVCLGGTAVNALMANGSEDLKITKVRGLVRKLGTAYMIATFHPSYVMRTKRMGNQSPGDLVVTDFKLAKKYLEFGRFKTEKGQDLFDNPKFMGSCSDAHAMALQANGATVSRGKSDKIIFIDGVPKSLSSINVLTTLDGDKYFCEEICQ